MDKYQKELFNDSAFGLYSVKTNAIVDRINSVPEKLVIKQDDDYTSKEYLFDIYTAYPVIDKIEFEGESSHNRIENKGKHVKVILSFDSKANTIVIHFANDLADPYKIELEYVEADKAAYDKRLEEEKIKQLGTIANVKVSSGDALINVRFQPVSDLFSYSKIELYCEGSLMAKYKTEEDVYFKSITGLAYGKYQVKLIQYDKNDKVIFTSDLISISLNRPNYGGKPTVVI